MDEFSPAGRQVSGSRAVQAKMYPRAEFSKYREINEACTVLGALNSRKTTQEVRDAFKSLLHLICAKCNRFESVHVFWWYASLAYIGVRDSRIKHYPCHCRFGVSFDVRNGSIGCDEHCQGYCGARKGWHALAVRISQGRPVDYHRTCTNPEYEGGCDKP